MILHIDYERKILALEGEASADELVNKILQITKGDTEWKFSGQIVFTIQNSPVEKREVTVYPNFKSSIS